MRFFLYVQCTQCIHWTFSRNRKSRTYSLFAHFFFVCFVIKQQQSCFSFCTFVVAVLCVCYLFFIYLGYECRAGKRLHRFPDESANNNNYRGLSVWLWGQSQFHPILLLIICWCCCMCCVRTHRLLTHKFNEMTFETLKIGTHGMLCYARPVL